MNTIEDLRVIEFEKRGLELMVTVEADNREALSQFGRQMVSKHVEDTAELAPWASAGIEAETGPMVIDADNPDKDVYEVLAEQKALKPEERKKPTWIYQQIFKLTRMI